MAEHTDATSAPLVGRLEALTVVAIVGLLALVLGVVALILPANKASTGRVAYRQSGTFSYRGTAPRGSIYGTAGVTSGEPIVTNIVKQVAVRFTYRLTSGAPVAAQGTQSLVANVKLNSGLNRQFTIRGPERFNSPTFTASGPLPLQGIVSYVDRSSTAVSGALPTGATVSIGAQVRTAGSVGGRVLATTFSPTLQFSLSANALTLSQSSSSLTTPSNDQQADPALTPSQTAAVTFRTHAAATVPLLVAHPPVVRTREVALGLAALFLLLALLVGRPLMRTGTTRNERDRVRALYGSMLVPVRSVAAPGAAIAEVASMGALAELAKRYECMIMHLRGNDGDQYMVWDNGIVYRHSIGPPPEPTPAVEPVDDVAESVGSASNATEAPRPRASRARSVPHVAAPPAASSDEHAASDDPAGAAKASGEPVEPIQRLRRGRRRTSV